MGSRTLDLIMEENITETTTESVMVTDTTVTISVPAHGACIKFNQSDPFKIGDKYGGIPLNLLTNTIGWSVLIIMFIFIRKNIVKKMGLSLAENLMTKHWCSVFFGRDNDPSEEIEESETSENSFNDEDENEEEVNIREDLPDTVAENRAISIREEDLEASAPLESAVSSRRSSIKSKRILTFHNCLFRSHPSSQLSGDTIRKCYRLWSHYPG